MNQTPPLRTASDARLALPARDCEIERSTGNPEQTTESLSPFRGRTAPMPDPTFHWVLLSIAIGVLALSCVLYVEAPEKVLIPVVDWALPATCAYKRWFGVDCPGCGLTRCFISLSHGDLLAAWHFNPAGILFFAVAVVQIPYRAIQLWRIRHGQRELALGWIPHLLFWSCFGSLLLQWILRTFVL